MFKKLLLAAVLSIGLASLPAYAGGPVSPSAAGCGSPTSPAVNCSSAGSPNVSNATGILPLANGGSAATTAGGALDTFFAPTTTGVQYLNRTAAGTYSNQTDVQVLATHSFLEDYPNAVNGNDNWSNLQISLLNQFIYVINLNNGFLSQDDQVQRTCVKYTLPKWRISVSDPVVVPPYICTDMLGNLRSITGTGSPSATCAFTLGSTDNCLATKSRPAILYAVGAHNTGNMNIQASNSSIKGSGSVFGWNAVPNSCAIVAGGTGYTNGDTLTLPQFMKNNYVTTTVTITASGGIATGCSIATAGQQPLPLSMLEYVFTTANGFTGTTGTVATPGVKGNFFDPAHIASGWFMTSGGTGTGAEVTLGFTPDFNGAGGNFFMGASLSQNTLMGSGQISTADLSTTPDATYGASFAVGINGLGFVPGEWYATGGYYGFWCNRASDVYGGRFDMTDPGIGVYEQGCSHVTTAVKVDTPSVSYGNFDQNLSGTMTLDMLYKGNATLAGPALAFGSVSGSSGSNMNAGQNFNLTCDSCGATTPITLMSIANTTDMHIRYHVSNLSKAGAAVNNQINAIASFGSNSTGNMLEGEIDNQTGAMFSGSVDATNSCHTWVAASNTYVDCAASYSLTSPLKVNSASATALQVVPIGTTNAAFVVDGSTASVAQGFTFKPAASGGTATVNLTDSGNASLNFLTAGSGTAAFGTAGSGSAALQTNGGNRVLVTNTKITVGPPVVMAGTKFTLSSCSATTLVGGSSAGKFTCGVTGACTQVITMNGASGSTATNGWHCSVSDRTTPANVFQTTADTTATATIAGTCVTNDIISFSCTGF